jgi:hypothetical protein
MINVACNPPPAFLKLTHMLILKGGVAPNAAATAPRKERFLAAAALKEMEAKLVGMRAEMVKTGRALDEKEGLLRVGRGGGCLFSNIVFFFFFFPPPSGFNF